MGDIRILVDIRNSPEILMAFLETFHYQTGWVVHNNAFVNNVHWKKYPNKVARYFRIDFEYKEFAWATKDDDKVVRGDYQVVETVEEAISIAEFAVANAEVFKCDPTKPFIPATPEPPPVQKINDNLPLHINIQKLKEYINSFIGFDSKLVFKSAILEEMYYSTMSKLYSEEPISYNEYGPHHKKQ